MWTYKGNVFTSEMLEDYVGFVYVVTESDTGKKYIGKKSFWSKLLVRRLKVKNENADL